MRLSCIRQRRRAPGNLRLGRCEGAGRLRGPRGKTRLAYIWLFRGSLRKAISLRRRERPLRLHRAGSRIRTHEP
jgi:hypothetical protein